MNQPQSIDERRLIAQRFVKDFNYQPPMVLDNMENEFESQFAAWPARYWIVFKKQLFFIAAPHEDHKYHIQEVKKWLSTFVKLSNC